MAPCLSLARSLTAHHFRHQDSRNNHAWVLPSTSLLKMRASPFAQWPCFNLARHADSTIFAGYLTTAGQYHPRGNTYLSFISYPQKDCQYRPGGNPLLPLMQIHALVVAHSRSPDLLSCLWCDSDCPNLLGSATLTTQTVISCIINFVSLFYNGIHVQLAGTPPRLSQRPVDVLTQPSYKKPVITCTTSRTSSQRTLATRTSLPCSTRTPLSLTL